MMNSQECKQFIQEDIQRMKSLDLEILPASIFYRNVLNKIVVLYLIMVGIPLLVMMAFGKSNILTLEFYVEDWLYLSILYGFISLFFLPKIAEYIVFKETIKPHLKLGAVIDAKFKFLFRTFAIIYTLWVLFDTNYLFSMDFNHFGERMFTVIVGIVLGSFITSLVFYMEISRIGLAAIFELISAFKKKDKKSIQIKE